MKSEGQAEVDTEATTDKFERSMCGFQKHSGLRQQLEQLSKVKQLDTTCRCFVTYTTTVYVLPCNSDVQRRLRNTMCNWIRPVSVKTKKYAIFGGAGAIKTPLVLLVREQFSLRRDS